MKEIIIVIIIFVVIMFLLRKYAGKASGTSDTGTPVIPNGYTVNPYGSSGGIPPELLNQ